MGDRAQSSARVAPGRRAASTVHRERRGPHVRDLITVRYTPAGTGGQASQAVTWGAPWSPAGGREGGQRPGRGSLLCTVTSSGTSGPQGGRHDTSRARRTTRPGRHPRRHEPLRHGAVPPRRPYARNAGAARGGTGGPTDRARRFALGRRWPATLPPEATSSLLPLGTHQRCQLVTSLPANRAQAASQKTSGVGGRDQQAAPEAVPGDRVAQQVAERQPVVGEQARVQPGQLRDGVEDEADGREDHARRSWRRSAAR